MGGGFGSTADLAHKSPAENAHRTPSAEHRAPNTEIPPPDLPRPDLPKPPPRPTANRRPVKKPAPTVPPTGPAAPATVPF